MADLWFWSLVDYLWFWALVDYLWFWMLKSNLILNNSGWYKIFHLSGQFGSLDPSVRFVILDTNWQFVKEQRSHLVFLLDSFWVSNSLLWEALAFISSEFERWTQYILSFCNQRASKANCLFVCASPIQLFVRRLARPTEHRKEIWILKAGLILL